MKILVFGASGMLGSAVINVLSEKDELDVYGTVRSENVKKYFSPVISKKLLVGYDVQNHDHLVEVFDKVFPDIVINCISLNKKLLTQSDPLLMIPIYSLLPHQMSKLCIKIGARLIHISTDGVFSGLKGGYKESDLSDASDLYGATKYLGEVHDSHTITLRTSIIGHELNSHNGLLSWFLNQKNYCKCFSNAIFSGLPTVVLAQIIRDIILPNPNLYGVYHVSAAPISKCNLLRLIAKIYDKQIAIEPDGQVEIDRSLDSERFRLATGYNAPNWSQLINTMHAYQVNSAGYNQ